MSLPSLGQESSSSQERVNPGEPLGSFAGERADLLFVLKLLAGKWGGENYLSDSEVATNYIKLGNQSGETPPRSPEPQAQPLKRNPPHK